MPRHVQHFPKVCRELIVLLLSQNGLGIRQGQVTAGGTADVWRCFAPLLNWDLMRTKWNWDDPNHVLIHLYCWTMLILEPLLKQLQAATVLASVAISVPGWASAAAVFGCVFRPMLRWVAAKTRLQPKRPWQRRSSVDPSNSQVIPLNLNTCVHIIYVCMYVCMCVCMYVCIGGLVCILL